MKPGLNRRDTLAVMIIQAIICKREAIRPTPRQAAKLAVEHTDFLLKKLDQPAKGNVRHITDWDRRVLNK
jgi:hypothetical protein